jgi:hypothetical protein
MDEDVVREKVVSHQGSRMEEPAAMDEALPHHKGRKLGGGLTNAENPASLCGQLLKLPRWGREQSAIPFYLATGSGPSPSSP